MKNYSVLIGEDKCSFQVIQHRIGLIQCKESNKPDILIPWTVFELFTGDYNLWSLKIFSSAYLFQIAQEKWCDYLYKHLLKNTTNNDFERKTWIEFYSKDFS